MLNFNFGRSFFFNGGTCEIKFLSSRLDSQGRVFAKVTNLVTGKRTLRLVQIGHGKDHAMDFRIDRGIPVMIH